MKQPDTLPTHPWLNNPTYTKGFQHIDGKGGFWHYGANRTADCVIMTNEHEPRVALITRKDNGLLALPGGFIDIGETALTAALREAREEIGVSLDDTHAEQIYDGPVADHRATRHAWPHTTAFRFLVTDPLELTASDDAADADWHSVTTLSREQLHGSHHALIIQALRPVSY